jgi:hypothetical protein
MAYQGRPIHHTIIVFKQLVEDFVEESKQPYDKVLLLLLRTPYGECMVDANLYEIGYVFNLSRERVRQLEIAVFRKFKRFDSIKDLYRYLELDRDMPKGKRGRK